MSLIELLIGGQRRPSADGATTEVIEPATGRAMATVAQASAVDLELAIATAHRAFESGAWRAMTASARCRTLTRAANLLRERAGVFVEAELRNGGKPVGNAEWEVNNTADLLEYYGGAADKFSGSVPPVDRAGLAVVLREPVGPCALVVPWNFPMVLLARKLAPALAMGNPVVIKPASLTPLTALMLGELLVEAGVPADTISVVPGPGRTLGDALCGDPRIAKISFTGSPETGAHVLRLAAPNITRVSLELGGKSACVVFADADVDGAAAAMPGGVFDNSGQDCCARSRVLVERSVYDRFVEGFVAATEALVVGDPADRSTEMGPMISAGQRQVALDYLEIGRQAGAEVVCGGQVPDREGFFLRPAVVANVANDMRIAREEIFGPVACVIPFDDEAHAVSLANDSPFGLSGSLYTRDVGRAIRVAKAIRTGILSVNSHSSAHTQGVFGGFKQSGMGRELGMGALEAYSETRGVFFSAQ